MYLRQLTPETLAQVAHEAAEILRRGGVVLFPTDTLYCLGADALSDTAVDAIYDIKGRESKKPMHALVRDRDMAERFGEISESARALVSRFGGKVSLVVPQRALAKTGILREMDTFGFRVPDHALCQALLTDLGGPITATSANVAGGEPGSTLGEVLAQLGPAVMRIDLAIDGGAVGGARPSTVVDMTGATPRILREGAIEAADIENVTEA